MIKMVILGLLLGQMMGMPERDDFEYVKFINSARVAKELNLTADQQKKINEIHYNYASKIIELRAQLQKKHLELNKLLSSEKYSKQDLESILKEMADYETQLRLNRILEIEEMKSVLTPEQRDKLRDMMGKRMRDVRERKRVLER